MTKHSIAPETVAIRRARREDAARIASLIMHGAPTATMTPAEISASYMRSGSGVRTRMKLASEG